MGLARVPRSLVVYLGSFGVYFAANHLIVMGALSRSMPVEDFGAFALVFSLAAGLAAITSRTMSNATIRRFVELGGHAVRPGALARTWIVPSLLSGSAAAAIVSLGGAFVGLPASASGWQAAAATGSFVTAHVLMDCVTTLRRARQEFGRVALGHCAYAALAVSSSLWLGGAVHPLLHFVAGAVGAGLAAGLGGVRPPPRRPESRSPLREAPPATSLGPFAVFAFASLAFHYGDRLVVGNALGAAAAASYFAISNSTMAAMMPVAVLGLYVQGRLAQYGSLEEAIRQVGNRLRKGAILLGLAGPVISALVGWVVLALVYPSIRADELVPGLIAFAIGRTFYAARGIVIPFLVNFGYVRSVGRMDLGLLAVQVVAVAGAARLFGLSGALVAGAIMMTLSGGATWMLCRTLMRDLNAPSRVKAT